MCIVLCYWLLEGFDYYKWYTYFEFVMLTNQQNTNCKGSKLVLMTLVTYVLAQFLLQQGTVFYRQNCGFIPTLGGLGTTI